MGRLFFDHIGGDQLYSCAACDINLTNRKELVSTSFTGATGRAFLFNKVVNIKYGYVITTVVNQPWRCMNIPTYYSVTLVLVLRCYFKSLFY